MISVPYPRPGLPDMDDRCRAEVHELHRFFADWFTGRVPFGDNELRRVRDVLHPEFEIITPAGRILDRDRLLDVLRRGYGTRSAATGFAIRVDGYRGRPLGAGVHLVRYEEWQKEPDGGARGRLSTALFREWPGTPNEVQWMHLHEVGLPSD